MAGAARRRTLHSQQRRAAALNSGGRGGRAVPQCAPKRADHPVHPARCGWEVGARAQRRAVAAAGMATVPVAATHADAATATGGQPRAKTQPPPRNRVMRLEEGRLTETRPANSAGVGPRGGGGRAA